MADDAADEVKVFRNVSGEDLETSAQCSQQLAEDKKDVVLEAELESRPPPLPDAIGAKGAFSKPVQSPAAIFAPNFNFPLAAACSPNYFMPLMPFLTTMNNGYGMRPMASPSFMNMNPALMNTFMGPMSPGYFNLLATGPGSPLYAAASAAAAAKMGAVDSVHLPANIRMAQNPLNQMNQMRVPFMGSPANTMNMPHDERKPGGGKSKKDEHVKKPLNAFMWYMKENRPKLMEEMGYKEKQSAELNKELGKRWQQLGKDEQQRYFELAKADREAHKEKYPNWSARENYAIHKRKKRKRDKSVESSEAKKCRARFGVGNQDRWCKCCKRKKKCIYAYERNPSDMANLGSGDLRERGVSVSASGSSTGPSPMNSFGDPSPLGPSPMQGPSDSESDVEDDEVDDVTLTAQELQDAGEAVETRESQHKTMLAL